MPDTLTVTITSIAFGGKGVARTAEGCVLFIPFAAVGDVAEVEITDQRKTYAFAKISRLVTPGPGRCQPACRHFGRCGGCAYQHLDYPVEFAAKRAQLAETLQRLGGCTDLPEFEAFPASEPMGYRNKLTLEPGEREKTDDGYRVSYGYYQDDNHTFFPVHECPLVRPEINRALPKAIHGPLGRQNAKRKPSPAKLVIRSDAARQCAFYFGKAPVRHPWLHEQLLGQDTVVPLGSFWQVNPPVADLMLRKLTGWVAGLGAETLIDAYSGVGTFSLALHGTPFLERILIENDPQAIEAANYNHQTRGLGCFAIAASTEKALPKQLAKCGPGKTLVVLDPPRTGCVPQVTEALCRRRPAHILYVSCNPTTLARDVKALHAGGYAIRRLALFDMFPRTQHFETAALLAADPI